DAVALQLLEPVREPARDAGDGEDRREEVDLDAELLVDDAAVEVDVRVDALGADEVGHLPLELDGDVVDGRAALLLEEALGEGLEDGRAGVLDLVLAVTEAHDLVLAGEPVLGP